MGWGPFLFLIIVFDVGFIKPHVFNVFSASPAGQSFLGVKKGLKEPPGGVCVLSGFHDRKFLSTPLGRRNAPPRSPPRGTLISKGNELYESRILSQTIINPTPAPQGVSVKARFPRGNNYRARDNLFRSTGVRGDLRPASRRTLRRESPRRFFDYFLYVKKVMPRGERNRDYNL